MKFTEAHEKMKEGYRIRRKYWMNPEKSIQISNCGNFFVDQDLTKCEMHPIHMDKEDWEVVGTCLETITSIDRLYMVLADYDLDISIKFRKGTDIHIEFNTRQSFHESLIEFSYKYRVNIPNSKISISRRSQRYDG